jgi:hypothetical protein
MNRPLVVLSLLACLASGAMLAGCSGDASAQRPAGPSVDEQVKKIESDPSMPPQAKAIAIQQLKARQGGSSGGASN